MNSCDRKKECVTSESFNPRSPAYISLETSQGKKYCIGYNELLKVTPSDVMNGQLGMKKRIDIYCGSIKLDSSDITKILNDINGVVYEISAIPDSINLKLMTEIALDSSGIFKIRDFDYNLRGNIIDAAIGKGYIVYFDDHEGEYFWERKN